MKKIAFRADARPSLGIGDLVSLINMSKYFEKTGWEAHFIIKNYAAALQLLKSHAIKKHFVLKPDISIDQEVDAINSYVESNGINVIMFEITERKLTDYDRVTNKAMQACVNFDGYIPDDMSLVVNWDVDAGTLYDTSRYLNTKFLLGPEYVILPIGFDFAKINNRAHTNEPKTILIAMGGADELNFTERIVDFIIAKRPDLKLHVVVGSDDEHFKNIRSKLERSSVKHVLMKNITTMFDAFMSCDAAIGAGGLTSYELIATRTPSYLIATYEHQISRCLYFDKMGWITYSGFRTIDENKLLKFLISPVRRAAKCVFKTADIRDSINETFSRH